MIRCLDKKTLGYKTVIFVMVFLVSIVFCVTPTLAQTTNFQNPENTAHSATLSFNVPTAQIKAGQEITVDVDVNSSLQAINAVSGTISFPGELVHVVSLNKDASVVKLWTVEPKLRSDTILFEGVILTPGFQGIGGRILSITFEAETPGTVNLNFNAGSVLANDGLGTNVLSAFQSGTFTIISPPTYAASNPIALNTTGSTPETPAPSQVALVPTITKYFPTIGPQENLYIGGDGTPLALTKIVFQTVSIESLGEKFIAFFQSKKDTPSNVLVQNDKNGKFHYISDSNLQAGVYNATPFLVNQKNDSEVPGTPVQILVNNSPIVKDLAILLNVLGLLIPIVLFIVIIYFIPWYAWRKMRVMKEKMLLEEEQAELTEAKLREEIPLPPPKPPIA